MLKNILAYGGHFTNNIKYMMKSEFKESTDNLPLEVIIEEDISKRIFPGKKTILYVSHKYDYNDKYLGLSLEHLNFYNTLVNMDYSLVYFDSDRLMKKYGIEKTSKLLREAAYYYRPDYLFHCLSSDWIDHKILKEISEEIGIKTLIWLSDDHWRFEESRSAWEQFDFVLTTDINGYNKRKNEGFENVILCQCGCNHFIYKKLNLTRKYDVSFVGRCYGQRKSFINKLRENGINVTAFGPGWENSDKIYFADLVRIYNQSKISLNIATASTDEKKLQLKTRVFEVAGCGSLLMTQHTNDLEQYYVLGKEIISYKNDEEAIEKIKYYLTNDKEREDIAYNGYIRTIKEHTTENRLKGIFNLVENLNNKTN